MKALKSLIFCLIVFLGVSSYAKAAPLSQVPSILYVKQGVTGNCFEWTTACDLQTALSTANPGDQVWVAKGTYKPTDTTDRGISFQLESGVAIYGGFAGTETVRTERIPATNITALSGNIGDSDVSTDNSYHVVTGYGVEGTEIDGTAIMDGFTISGGNANHSDFPNNIGGGMYNTHSSPALTNVTFSGNSATYGGGMFNTNNSSPTLTNVTFTENSAAYYGGGMYNQNSSSPTLTNVTFSGNSAFFGGGMYNDFSSPTLTNVTFNENSATSGGGMYNDNSSPILTNVTFSANSTSYGGGMSNKYSSPKMTNVTFTKNSAAYYGGGMDNSSSSPTVTNAIVWGNTPTLQIYNDDSSTPVITYSNIQGGYAGGTNIIVDDPLLGPLANNGGFTQTHALLSGSPAIDAGNPGAGTCPATDQRGFLRPFDSDGTGSGICDMGAYEYGFTLTVQIVGSGSVVKNPNNSYNFGDIVTLTATPATGWVFSGWSGATVTDNNLTITGNTVVTANFTRIYKLYLPLILKN